MGLKRLGPTNRPVNMEALQRSIETNDWITAVFLMSLLCLVFARAFFYPADYPARNPKGLRYLNQPASNGFRNV